MFTFLIITPPLTNSQSYTHIRTFHITPHRTTQHTYAHFLSLVNIHKLLGICLNPLQVLRTTHSIWKTPHDTKILSWHPHTSHTYTNVDTTQNQRRSIWGASKKLRLGPLHRFCILGTSQTQSLWFAHTPRTRPVDFIFLQVNLVVFLDF